MPRIVKQYLKYFLIIGLVLGATFLFIWWGRYTVTSEKKYASFSGVSYGYQIEQYYFWNTTRITIWNRRGLSYQLDAVYEFGKLTVDKVVEEKWLKDDLAIYLNLEIKYHDSVVSVHPAKFIYDFHRGELHTSSEFTLWRIWNEKDKPDGWMAEREFDAVLKSLSR